MPRLRRLRSQESVATDDGLRGAGQVADARGHLGARVPELRQPRLRRVLEDAVAAGLGISCKNVDDAALATLPDFPALRELTPIGFQDDGFRHIGRCRASNG